MLINQIKLAVQNIVWVPANLKQFCMTVHYHLFDLHLCQLPK